MLKVDDQIKKMAALTGVMLMAAAEAMAQDKSSRLARRVVVSIPDRKLAVLEGDRIVRIFETAVGAPKSPSPTGVYQIVNSIADPTWYTKGKIVPPGKCNPLGTRWLGLSRKGYGIHARRRSPGDLRHRPGIDPGGMRAPVHAVLYDQESRHGAGSRDRAIRG